MNSVYHKNTERRVFCFIIFKSPILYPTKKTELNQFYVFLFYEIKIYFKLLLDITVCKTPSS